MNETPLEAQLRESRENEANAWLSQADWQVRAERAEKAACELTAALDEANREADALDAVVKKRAADRMQPNGWSETFPTWYHHSFTCRGFLHIHYNDTGLYFECTECKAHKSIDMIYPETAEQIRNRP